jgi:hypothetical protein
VGHHVKGIDDKEEPRKIGDLPAFEAFRVPGAVPVLMMGEDLFGYPGGIGEGPDDLQARLGMLFDYLPFIDAQRPLLHQDLPGDNAVADIVQPDQQIESFLLVFRELQGLTESMGEFITALDMKFMIAVLCPGQGEQSGKHFFLVLRRMNKLIVVHELFCLAHGLVDVPVPLLLGGGPDGDTGRQRCSPVFAGELFDAGTEYLRCGELCFRQDDGELIASPPGYDVALAACFPEAVRHCLEQGIAFVVAEEFVGKLEVVDIAHDDADRQVPLGVHPPELFFKEDPVEKPCHAVMKTDEADLLLGPHPSGDVPRDDQHCLHQPGLVELGDDPGEEIPFSEKARHIEFRRQLPPAFHRPLHG